MSRKGKKRAKAKYRQPMRPAGPLTPATGGTASGTATTATRTSQQARVGGDQALVRSVEMSLGSTNRIIKGRGGRFTVESADPSIPLDRVPYFTKDLVRLLVVGAAMVVLLGLGSVTVPLIVK
ncbi:MAG TPA: hypothetical protein VFL27_10355 [Candidatus Dormibacteraeota bacterium]|nr:hypothetical protein [Candidatus Dormibacteraeota bacterium]